METLHVANGLASLVGAIALSWVVLHPKIHEGIMVKAGLVMMILSLASTATLTLTGTENWDGLWRAGFALRLGLCIVVFGVGVRLYSLPSQTHRFKRRHSDWVKRHGS